MTTTLQLPAFMHWLDTDGKVLVSEAIAARAIAEVERERVDAYIIPFFLTWHFRADKDRRGLAVGDLLTNPDQLYLSDDDERAAEYYAACDKLHREHGFTGPDGHCPALIAENTRMEAERAVIESLSALLGTEPPVTLEHRAQLLDIAMRAAVQRMDETAGRRA